MEGKSSTVKWDFNHSGYALASINLIVGRNCAILTAIVIQLIGNNKDHEDYWQWLRFFFENILNTDIYTEVGHSASQRKMMWPPRRSGSICV